MAKVTLDMSGVGANDGFPLTGAATKALAVAGPDDDDTSYITASGNITVQDLIVADAPLQASDTITNVRLRVRAKQITGSPALDVTPSSSGSSGSTTSLSSWISSYGDKTIDYANAPDGGSWTLDKLNDLAIQLHQTGVGPHTLRITTIQAEVTYTPAPTGAPAGTLMMMGAGR